jgi:beta-lactamase regulating signal transducer with metallopeptidase domain
MSIEFLVQMAWKSALIAGGALAIAALLRRRSADERAAVLRTGVALILALPLLVWALPALQVETWAAPAPAPIVTTPAFETGAVPPMAVLPMSSADLAAQPAVAAPSVLDDPTPLILLAWLGGIAMVALRLLAGLWTLRRWTRSGQPVECPAWRAAFEAEAGRSPRLRKVRLLVSDAPSPLGWGWLDPVVLIDRDTIRSPEEAEAVLAHELAHVERRDWLVLVLARIAVALFWFNPLMWLLERRMIDEAEEAADARAVARVEPARYAQTLLTCAQTFPGVPATAIADTGLARRVKAVLEGKLRASTPRRVRTAMALCVLAAAPVAALKPVAASLDAPPAPEAPLVPHAPPAPSAFPGIPPAAPAAPAAAPMAPRTPAAAPAPFAAASAMPGRPGAAPLAPPAPLPFAIPAPRAAAAPPAPPAPPTPGARRRSDDRIWTDEDQREMEEDLAEAAQEVREATEEVRREMPRIAEQARAAARAGMVAGAAGMAGGADGMERGARGMETEADRLRSRDYRAAEIRRAARRGEHVTDQQLQDLIPHLREGAQALRRSADEMREQARHMRDGED